MAGRMVHAALNTCFMHTAFAQVCNRSSFRLELIYTGSAGGFLHCEYAAGVELAMLMVPVSRITLKGRCARAVLSSTATGWYQLDHNMGTT